MSLSAQLSAADSDRIRVLVVGAGVAGVTAAQLLRGAGLSPVLVERANAGTDAGYMLALMPMVDAAVGELGVRQRYLAASVPLGRFGLRSHTGKSLREDSLGGLFERFGDYRGISRGELLDVLAAGGGAVSYGTTVAELHETTTGVTARFDAGDEHTEAEFDLVIAADGIHSTTRDLAFGPGRVEKVDTGWGGWVVWCDQDGDPDLAEELWGAGFFVGSYPVAGGIGAFVGGARKDTAAGQAAFVAHIRNRLRTRRGRLEGVLDAVARTDDAFYWPLADVRAQRWATDRVVLLGDAAAGFLPTAGIGAGMAMESAWMLAGTLGDARAAEVPGRLRDYLRIQRPRVEAAQDNSRKLAKLMFRRNKAIAAARDVVMSVVSIDTALGPIKKLLADQPTPRQRV